MINKRIKEAIKMLRCFPKSNQYYWLGKLSLCSSDKGFIYLYLGLSEVL